MSIQERTEAAAHERRQHEAELVMDQRRKVQKREEALKVVLVGVRRIAEQFETASGENATDPDLEALLRLTVAEAGRRYESVSGNKPWGVS